MSSTCQVDVLDNLTRKFHVCGRKSKDVPDNPEGLCGIHLRQRSEEARKEEERRRESAATQALIDEFAAYGVDVYPQYWNGKYDLTSVMVRTDVLRRLVQKGEQK